MAPAWNRLHLVISFVLVGGSRRPLTHSPPKNRVVARFYGRFIALSHKTVKFPTNEMHLTNGLVFVLEAFTHREKGEKWG